jgi:hypothetical protein
MVVLSFVLLNGEGLPNSTIDSIGVGGSDDIEERNGPRTIMSKEIFNWMALFGPTLEHSTTGGVPPILSTTCQNHLI